MKIIDSKQTIIIQNYDELFKLKDCLLLNTNFSSKFHGDTLAHINSECTIWCREFLENDIEIIPVKVAVLIKEISTFDDNIVWDSYNNYSHNFVFRLRVLKFFSSKDFLLFKLRWS